MIRCDFYEDGRRCELEEGHPGNCVPSENLAAEHVPVEQVYEELYGVREWCDSEWEIERQI